MMCKHKCVIMCKICYPEEVEVSTTTSHLSHSCCICEVPSRFPFLELRVQTVGKTYFLPKNKVLDFGLLFILEDKHYVTCFKVNCEAHAYAAHKDGKDWVKSAKLRKARPAIHIKLEHCENQCDNIKYG